MERAFVIAAASLALRRLLENQFADWKHLSSVGGEVPISLLPLDRIHVGADERTQINLFLYQVRPNTGVRLESTGGVRTPLALDLFYLLTVYGAHDLQLEVLLGAAIQIFHQAAQLGRERLKELVSGSGDDDSETPPLLSALLDSRAFDEIDTLTIHPQFIESEELSRTWSSFQSHYRPSVAYRVTMTFKGQQPWL